MTTAQRSALAFGLAAAALAAAPAAYAAEPGSLDRIVDLFRDGSNGWESTLLGYAKALFGLLVAIDVAWTMCRLVLKSADMGEWTAEFVNRIMFVGFFGALLTNSAAWSEAIVNSFRQAGNEAAQAAGGSGGVSPSDIFDAGLKMATTVLQTKVDLSLAGLGQATALMIAAVVVCVCFGLIGAFLIVALVESYIVTSAGVLLMGFGGSRWTKDFAVKGLTYAVSVGAKLFMIQLIAGLGEAMIKAQAAAITPESAQKPEDVLVVVGFSVVMLALVKTIPDTVQGLINGTSVGTSGGNFAAAAVAGAAAAATGNALGAGAAIGSSMRLASQQLAAEGSTASGIGRAAAITGRAAANLGSAATSDVGARLGGRARGGTVGGRMAFDMSSQSRELAREMAKPPQPVAMAQGAPAMAGAGSMASGGVAEAMAGSIRPEAAASSAAGEGLSGAGAAPAPSSPAGPAYEASDGSAPAGQASEAVSGAAADAAQPRPATTEAVQGAQAAPPAAKANSTPGSEAPRQTAPLATGDDEDEPNAARPQPLGSRLGGRAGAPRAPRTVSPAKPKNPPEGSGS